MTHYGGGPRVLMTTDAVGGVWSYSCDLARELAARGCRVTLVTLGPAPRAHHRTTLAGAPYIALIDTDLTLEWMDPEGRDHRRMLDCLSALAREIEPDIVHINGFREAQADWRAPIVVAAHSCVRSWWLACRGDEPDRRWAKYVSDVGHALSAADAWVAPTAAFRATMQRLYAPTHEGHVVFNGVHAECAPEISKQSYILAAGRMWDEAKNLRALAAAASKLLWPTRVAGALTQGAESPPALDGDEIRWIGELSRAELRQEMRKAAIFVAPSIYEPFGLGPLEAAASGCALVLSDIATFRELWDGAALFIDPQDAQALALGLNLLCRDHVLRERLQRRARRRAERYTSAAMAEGYRAIYSDAMTDASLARHLLVRSGTEARA